MNAREAAMPIKQILVPATGGADTAHVPLCAMNLAKPFAAHVVVSYADAAPEAYVTPVDVPVAPIFYSQLHEAVGKMRAELRQKARAHFDAAVAATKLPIVDKPTCAQASAVWMDGADVENAPIAALGPLADLIVIHKPGERADDWLLLEDALFVARRPVLVLPNNHAEVDCRRVVVAWNGSNEAAAAAQRAVDLMLPGAKVTIVQVGEVKGGGRGAEYLGDYLGWHCLETAYRRSADEGGGTGRVLHYEAKNAGAGLIVMGAYGHSRLREMVLGGVTRYMLEHATIPLLLVH
jgi:nucleotide-binding universal stress UspA family protein